MKRADGLQVPALSTVEIEHADSLLAAASLPEVDDLERRTEHMTDAEGDRARMDLRVRIIQKIRDDLVGAGLEDFLGNPRTRLRLGQRDAAAGTRQLLRQPAALLGEQHEATLGARELEGAVEHDRQHFVEDLRRAERAQTRKQRVDLPEIERRRGAGDRVAAVVLQLGLPQADRIAWLDLAVVDFLFVDECAEPRSAVP